MPSEAADSRAMCKEFLMVEACLCGSCEWDEAAALQKRRCRGCGLLSPVHAPDSRNLAAWYEKEYWKHYREEQMGMGRDNIYRHALAWLTRLLPGRVTVLDIGCGGGRFLSLCQAQGWKAIGVEPSQDAAMYARRRGLEVHSQAWPGLAIADESVDVVTFINVLDHLPDPFEALREAFRVLKPTGLLYVRVPNAPLHAWAKRLLVHAGLEDMAVLHVYGFGRRSLSRLLPRLAFVPMAVRAAPPAKGHPYETDSTLLDWGYASLKLADRLWYWVLRILGLGRLGWGPSLEVLARKAPSAVGVPS